MQFPEAAIDALTPLSRPVFERIRKAELVPSANLTGLRLLREKSANERNLRELYRDRAPFELLQNADDAGASSGYFVLAADGLGFGHNGKWFTIENFRSLAEGWSSKKPGEFIGHKGLGFRSVLDITPAPVVGYLSANRHEEFAFRFSWKNNKSFIDQVLSASPDLQRHFSAWTQHGLTACPVMAIPTGVRVDSLGGGTTAWNLLLSLGCTTMFWLPATDTELPRSVVDQLSIRPICTQSGRERLLDFLSSEMSLVLPFLRNLSAVSVLEGKSEILRLEQSNQESTDRGRFWIRASSMFAKGIDLKSRRIFQTGTRLQIPANIRTHPDTPRAVQGLSDIGLTLAVELHQDQPVPLNQAPFYVYFPTEDFTGTGFIVHADFHVEPHRKHLMAGAFNDWLIQEAARFAAGDFLTELLARFSPAAVFNALGPTLADANAPFLTQFSKHLQNRSLPFVPTSMGLVPKSAAVLAPNERLSEYYEDELLESLQRIQPDCRLVSHEVDCARTRAFLKMAGVLSLSPDSLVDLIEEAASVKNRSVEWWLSGYAHMVTDPVISQRNRDYFVSRRLVPGESGVLEIPPIGEGHLCLPPQRIRHVTVPTVFQDVFTFVESDLSEQLDDRNNTVAAWTRDRFGISRFEATELLPRAIGAVAGRLYSGERPISRSELIEMWRFVRSLTSGPRVQTSEDLWKGVSRLPIPTESVGNADPVDPHSLAPAFLLYWPETLRPEEIWMSGLEMSRACPDFLTDVAGGSFSSDWAAFFSAAGLSAGPKLLRYSRMPGHPEVPLSSSNEFAAIQFTGERQRDENAFLLQTVRKTRTWQQVLGEVERCSHSYDPVMHSVNAVHGLSECCSAAVAECSHGDKKWKTRLESLCRHVARLAPSARENDSAFCRAGGGHPLKFPSLVAKQIQNSLWLPSSKGPATPNQCFLRQPMHRVISGSEGELNDAILPFVVAEDLNLHTALSEAGVPIFETVRDASPKVLVSALNEIGSALTSEWGREYVIQVPQRWRAVRGAIQEIFRSLNGAEQGETWSVNFLPIRRPAGVEFVSPPVWYAAPGVLRDAFEELLPLLDSDRPYPNFFPRARVTPLVAGDTVKEQLTFSSQLVRAEGLQRTITGGLAGYLLAMLAARLESDTEIQLASRRLRERLSVMSTSGLRMQLELATDSRIRTEHSADRYYLRREVSEIKGALEQAQFTLYVVHEGDPKLAELDADAIGVHLASVLQDQPSAEMAALCARISTRYKEVSGDSTSMREFMYHHLHVSMEMQEAMRQELNAQEVTAAPPILPPPPIIISGASPGSKMLDMPSLLQEQQSAAATHVMNLMSRFLTRKSGNSSSGNGNSQTANGGLGGSNKKFLSEDQVQRGIRGEEEIKRRLCLPGGWYGLSFKSDVRTVGCGCDFFAIQAGGEIRLEVKTFTRNGRMVFTSRELSEAATNGQSYFVIGLLDDGGAPQNWPSFLVTNPLALLLSKGIFSFDAELQIEPEALGKQLENMVRASQQAIANTD